MNELKEFIIQNARPLPVILLLDVSGSMSGEKIFSLNNAVKEMLRVFANETSTQAELNVCIITFDDVAKLHTPLQPASKIHWADFNAIGMTALGAALDMARNIIENKETIPSRAYRPVVVLVSDGEPNDKGWEEKLNRFVNEGRTSKCDRFAMGIGSADEQVLKSFINDENKKVFHAQDAGTINKFFKFITMSTLQRSRSASPNEIIKYLPDNLSEFDFFAD